MPVTRVLVLAVGLGIAAVLPSPHGTAAAGCAGPYLELDQSSRALPAGSPVTVEGQGFFVGCNDTGGGDVWGCWQAPEEVERPMRDVELVLRQDGRRWVLATADAGTDEGNRLGQIRWEVQLPADARPGAAVLDTRQSQPLRIRIR